MGECCVVSGRSQRASRTAAASHGLQQCAPRRRFSPAHGQPVCVRGYLRGRSLWALCLCARGNPLTARLACTRLLSASTATSCCSQPRPPWPRSLLRSPARACSCAPQQAPPAYSNGVVFYPTMDPNGTMYALDARTGAQLAAFVTGPGSQVRG